MLNSGGIPEVNYKNRNVVCRRHVFFHSMTRTSTATLWLLALFSIVESAYIFSAASNFSVHPKVCLESFPLSLAKEFRSRNYSVPVEHNVQFTPNSLYFKDDSIVFRNATTLILTDVKTSSTSFYSYMVAQLPVLGQPWVIFVVGLDFGYVLVVLMDKNFWPTSLRPESLHPDERVYNYGRLGANKFLLACLEIALFLVLPTLAPLAVYGGLDYFYGLEILTFSPLSATAANKLSVFCETYPTLTAWLLVLALS